MKDEINESGDNFSVLLSRKLTPYLTDAYYHSLQRLMQLQVLVAGEDWTQKRTGDWKIDVINGFI